MEMVIQRPVVNSALEKNAMTLAKQIYAQTVKTCRKADEQVRLGRNGREGPGVLQINKQCRCGISGYYKVK